MSAPRLPLTLPYREASTDMSRLLPGCRRMWYASGVLEHIVRVVAVKAGGRA